MTEGKTSGMKPDKDGIYEMTDVRRAYPDMPREPKEAFKALANYFKYKVD
jgi:hypothetical protein